MFHANCEIFVTLISRVREEKVIELATTLELTLHQTSLGNASCAVQSLLKITNNKRPPVNKDLIICVPLTVKTLSVHNYHLALKTTLCLRHCGL